MKTLGLLLAVAVVGACAAHEDNELPPETALSAAGAKDSSPAYSPDGSRVAYWAASTDSTSGNTLWIANADGTAPVKLMNQGLGYPLLWSPDGTQLATGSSQAGLVHAVVVPAGGGTPRRITTGQGIDYPVAWYPSGDRIAYLTTAVGGSFSSLAASLKTGASTPMVPSEHRPYLAYPSPDGAHVAYNVIDRGTATIWVADSDGSHPRQLTTEGFEGFNAGLSPWSPDGTEVLYESNRTGTSDLWVAPIDGRPLRQLTRDVRNDQAGVWSPDGRWVAFRSDRGRQWNVWVVAAAGGDARQITDDPQGEASLAWRPRSHTLAFVRTTSASAVWAMDLASGAERRLTPDSVRTAGFYLSPNGTQLDYVVDLGGGVQALAVMPVAGGASRTVVPPVGSIQYPLWSPDGTKIAFLSDRGGMNHVWVVDVAGGAPRALTSWSSSENSLSWSGDGSEVYFVSLHDSKFTDLWKVPVAGGDPQRVTTAGNINSIGGRTGGPDLYANTYSPRAGQLAIERIRPDGHQQTVWDKTNSYINYGLTSPSGDSLIAEIEQPGGAMRSMIIAANGGGGRVILNPNEYAQFWSVAGRSITYVMTQGGETDVGLYDVATGAKRVLMHTPDDEDGAEISHDGKTLVFNRNRTVSRIYTVDLTKLLAAPGK